MSASDEYSTDAEVFGRPLASMMPSALLFLLISGMAGSCDANQLVSKFTSTEARGIVAGIVCQYVVLPFMGFLSLTLFPQDPVVALTLLMVTTSPGGGFSGFWCSVVNADLALSVAMTTASTIAVTAALPINIYLYINAMFPDMEVAIAWDELIISVIVVVLAVIFGSSVSWAAAKWMSKDAAGLRQGMNTLGSAAGVCLMVFGGATNASSDTPLWENTGDWFACIGLPCVLGLVAALGVARSIDLAKPSSVAVAIECCYQNTGLALTIALSAVPPEAVGRASGVPIFYGLVEIALIPIFALIAWKAGWTYAPADENPCVAFARNYQPSEERQSAIEDPSSEPPHVGLSGEQGDEERPKEASGPEKNAVKLAEEAFPGDKAKMVQRASTRMRPQKQATFKFKKNTEDLGEGSSPSTRPTSPHKLLSKFTQLHLDLSHPNFAETLVKGKYQHKDKELDVNKLLDQYVEGWITEDESLKATSREMLKRDMLSQKAVMESARTKGRTHHVDHILLACSEDQGKHFRSNARLAERARVAQYQLIKGMILAGAVLPYRIMDATDRPVDSDYERGLWSFLREVNIVGRDTRITMLRHANARLVQAFATNFSEDELEQVLAERFFEDPALLVYQVSRLCEAASKEAGRTIGEGHESLKHLVEKLQSALAELLAFIDCPHDVDKDDVVADYYPRPLIDLVLCHQRGWLALRIAAECDCKILLGHVKLKSFFTRHRRGTLYHQLQTEFRDVDFQDFQFHTRLIRNGYVALVGLANLMLIPILPFMLIARQCWTLFQHVVASLSSGWYTNLEESTTRTIDREASGSSLWMRSEAKPQYTASTAVKRWFHHGFELGGGIRSKRYEKACNDDCGDCQIGADRFRFPWLNSLVPPALYMLEDPWLETWMRELGELAQLLFLSALRTWTDPVQQSHMVKVNFFWCIAVFCTEVQELSRTGKLYLNNGLNRIQITGLVLVLISLSYEFFAEGLNQKTSRSIMSVGILLLWLHTLRIFFRFQSMGSLVYILFEMFKDVAKWIVLQVFVTTSFGVALFSLYYDKTDWRDECPFGMRPSPDMGYSQESWLPNLEKAGNDTEAGFFEQTLSLTPGMHLIARIHDLTDGLFYMVPLFGTSLMGDNKLDCLRNTEHALTGPFLMLGFMISTIVVLTNMLIAMMNYSFTKYYNEGDRLFLMTRARETIYAKSNNSWRPPTPFNLLFVLQSVFKFLLEFVKAGSSRDTDEEDKDMLAPSDSVLKQLDAAAIWWEEKRTRKKADLKVEQFIKRMHTKAAQLVDEKFDVVQEDIKAQDPQDAKMKQLLRDALNDVLDDKKVLKDPGRRLTAQKSFKEQVDGGEGGMGVQAAVSAPHGAPTPSALHA